MMNRIPRVNEYVRLLATPQFPEVEAGDIGRVVGDYWLERDGSLNVDVVAGTGYVNLTFMPTELEVISERDLRSRDFSIDHRNQRAVQCYRKLSGDEYREWVEMYRR